MKRIYRLIMQATQKRKKQKQIAALNAELQRRASNAITQQPTITVPNLGPTPNPREMVNIVNNANAETLAQIGKYGQN